MDMIRRMQANRDQLLSRRARRKKTQSAYGPKVSYQYEQKPLETRVSPQETTQIVNRIRARKQRENASNQLKTYAATFLVVVLLLVLISIGHFMC